ncbi:MAG: class I fructose-bisphosphate aldolase [Candidatus Levyibacteriota bacterium]
MGFNDEMQATIERLVQPGKGILAADESLPTIGKRFAAVGVESTPENRQAYRSMLFSTPGVEAFVSGVILFEETLAQRDPGGTPLPEVLVRVGIVPGIKVDQGKVPLAHAPGDEVTQGLDGLAARLKTYRGLGARFAKWREVYKIGPRNPTPLGVEANAEVLARYAAVCQEEGLVPIVEPEVLIDGDHTMERCEEVIDEVLHAVYHALHRHRVVFEHTLLKPSMVLPGKERKARATPDEVALATLRVLKRNVPAAVPGINFLSGGQGPEEATANLNAMNARYPTAPWALSFSYGRALQDHAMKAWAGNPGNAAIAQRAFYRRARLNGLARQGTYEERMERDD